MSACTTVAIVVIHITATAVKPVSSLHATTAQVARCIQLQRRITVFTKAVNVA